MVPQAELVRWAGEQAALTGAVLLALGLVYTFYGNALSKLLLVFTCAGLGWAGGVTASVVGELPELPAAICGAIALAGFAAGVPRVAVSLTAIAIWGVLSAYLVAQFGPSRTWLWSLAGVGAGLGLLFSILCHRTMNVILTVLQGTVLMLIGWIALMCQVAPAVGCTFRTWAGGRSFIVPVFLGMLFTMGYSYQAMRRQGDVKTGA